MPGRHLSPTSEAERAEIIRLRKTGVPMKAIAAELRRAIGKVTAVLIEEGMHESKPYVARRKHHRAAPEPTARPRRASHPHVIESSFITPPSLAKLMSGRG